MLDTTRTITRIAIVSDTHGVLDSRIAGIVSQSDIAIHAGDIGDASILDIMRPRSGQVFAVAGNNDLPFLWPNSQLGTLKSIPEIAELAFPGGKITVEHGDRHDRIAPDHSTLRNAHPDSRLIIYGHTHKMVIDTDQRPWVVNPGAAGETRTRGGPSCLVLSIDGDNWEVGSIRFED